MDIRKHIIENAAIYVVTAVLLPLAWLGFMAVMDTRHEKIGATVESDLREINREIRQLENYERFVPSDDYGPARQAMIAELKDEKEELQRKLDSYQSSKAE